MLNSSKLNLSDQEEFESFNLELSKLRKLNQKQLKSNLLQQLFNPFKLSKLQLPDSSIQEVFQPSLEDSQEESQFSLRELRSDMLM